MQRPRQVSGMCPHFDHPANRCYLTEGMQSGYTFGKQINWICILDSLHRHN